VALCYAEGQDKTPYWEQAKQLVDENERVCRRVEALHMLAFQMCHEARWHFQEAAPRGDAMTEESFAGHRRRFAERSLHAGLARGVPEEVLLALFEAVKADSEEPLQRLPAEWSTRTIEAFRECREA
jgi:hypothetical protein